MAVVKAGAKAACYLLTLPILIFWNFGPLFFPITLNFLVIILFVLGGLTLVAYFAYRTFTHLRAASALPAVLAPPAVTALAERVDVFLYETRKGSLAMLGLSVVWALDVLLVIVLAWVDLALGGPVRGAVNKGSDAKKILGLTLVLLSWLGLPAVLVLVVVNGAKALWRIAAPRGQMRGDGEDEFELVGDDDEDDEDVERGDDGRDSRNGWKAQ